MKAAKVELPDVSMDRILGRTRQCGDCMEWAGYAIGGKTPQIRVDYKCWPVRRLVYQLVHGVVASRLWIGCKCKNPLCVNPDHLVARTRGTVFKGAVRTIAHRNNIATARRQGGKITKEMVDEIRSSSESNGELAKRLGVTHSHISAIRFGKRWREYSSPFAGLGAR